MLEASVEVPPFSGSVTSAVVFGGMVIFARNLSASIFHNHVRHDKQPDGSVKSTVKLPDGIERVE